jgi:antitoxin (DNA-binding transcriptional repressor) of toxin-antitoxin stability system
LEFRFPIVGIQNSNHSHAYYRFQNLLTEVATRSYIDVMRAVGIKVLKNKLSEYVRLAEQGETVLVTDRDRVVAELSPPHKSRSPMMADALLAEAVRHGWITPPSMPLAGPPPRKPVMSVRDLVRELEQDRGDR